MGPRLRMCTVANMTTVGQSSSGRGVVADQDVPAGTVVCESNAVAYAALRDKAVDLCHFCLRSEEFLEGVKLRRCSACQWARYCCVEHQKQAWNSWHNAECAFLRKLRASGKRKPVGASERLCAQLLRKGGDNGSVGLVDISGLETHRDHSLNRQGLDLVGTAGVLARILGRKLPELLDERSVIDYLDNEIDVLCKLQCNAATISDHELRPLGIGLFPQAWFFNHSCEPSCVQSYRFVDGKMKMVVRTIRPVRRGEELMIAYIDPVQPWDLRQEELYDGYAFKCDCRRCKTERTSQPHPALSADARSAERLQRLGNLSEARALLGKLVVDNKKQPASFMAKCLYLQTHVMIGLGEFNAATQEACAGSIRYMKKCHISRNMPVLALQQATLGKLALYLEDMETARSAFVEAVEGLTVCYGADVDIVHTCELLLEQVRYELGGHTNNSQ